MKVHAVLLTLRYVPDHEIVDKVKDVISDSVGTPPLFR